MSLSDHDLNKLLAEVAGVEVLDDPPTRLWMANGYGGCGAPWTPLTDHGYMALVKAGLRKQGYEWLSNWDADLQTYEGEVNKRDEKGILRTWYQDHKTSELRALAYAIAKMKGY